MNIILVGAIFAIVGGIIGAIGTWLQHKNSSEKSDRIESTGKSTNDIVQQQSKIITSLREDLLEKQTELINANEEIIILQKEVSNQITGGSSIPFLKLITTPMMQEKSINYCIVYFEVINNGTYPLQNVKATVYDMWTYATMEKGILQKVDGRTTFAGPPTREELNNEKPVHHIDIGSLVKGKIYSLYTANYSPELTLGNIGSYQVEIQWNNGYMFYFINLDFANNKKAKIESVNLSINGKPVKNISNFFSLTNGQ